MRMLAKCCSAKPGSSPIRNKNIPCHIRCRSVRSIQRLFSSSDLRVMRNALRGLLAYVVGPMPRLAWVRFVGIGVGVEAEFGGVGLQPLVLAQVIKLACEGISSGVRYSQIQVHSPAGNVLGFFGDEYPGSFAASVLLVGPCGEPR